jgi:DNA-binding LacI/PurR family transcriptional regulator
MTEPPIIRRPSRSRTTRLQDVAERAGVTKSIASRILNGTNVAVRAETRERVFAAARELEYWPHPAARALSRAVTGTVALLVPDLTNAAYSRIVRGAVRVAPEMNLCVVVIEDTPSGEETASLLASGRIDGVIMLAARPGHPLLPLLTSDETACVFAHRGVPGSDRNVVIDDARGSELAIEHLFELGHRRVGHVAGPSGLDTADRRAAGFRAAADRLGLELAPVVNAEFTEQGGADAAGELLSRHPELTAMFVASLPQAIGVRAAASRHRLEVPKRLSIVAYDELPLVRFLDPPLTTVRVPLEELGETALRALHAQISGEPPEARTIPTSPEIVVRQSTAEAS